MADEKPEKKPDSGNWLGPFIKPLRPIFREVLVMSLFVNLLALAVPIFTMQVYDRVIFKAGMSTLQGLVIGMALVVVFDNVLRQARSRIMQKAALRIDVWVGRKLVRKLLALPLATLESRPNAHWQALFRDTEMVRNTISGPTTLLVADLPFAIMFLALIFVIAKPIVWVLAIILPTFVFLAWRSANKLSTVSNVEKQTGFGRDALISETIAGRMTVKALSLENTIQPMWEERHAETIEESLVRGKLSDQYVNFGAGLTLLSTIALTTVGALAILDQQMTMGSLIASNMLMGRILGPFNQLVGSWRNYAQFKQAVGRLGEMFQLTEDRTESAIHLDLPRGEMRVEQVTFRYGDEPSPVIDNMRLEIKPGNMVAVMGSNGSGKTTLIKLLQGLYQPSDGRILLDNADISQFSRHDLSTWIGYVPQEVFLFTGSIRENIAKPMPEATDQQVVEAAQASGLHDRIIDMPEGYATDIGEAGRRLPGGLRQRIAIARAFLNQPPVMILDEPSANLDREGEAELAESLRAYADGGKTVVVVTHSGGMLSACDQVLILQKGRLVRAGRPEDILPQMLGANARQTKAPTRPQQPAEQTAPDAPAEASIEASAAKPRPLPIPQGARQSQPTPTQTLPPPQQQPETPPAPQPAVNSAPQQPPPIPAVAGVAAPPIAPPAPVISNGVSDQLGLPRAVSLDGGPPPQPSGVPPKAALESSMGEPPARARPVPHLRAVESTSDTAEAHPELGQPRAVYTQAQTDPVSPESAAEHTGTPEPEPDDSHDPTQPLPMQTSSAVSDPTTTGSGRERV